MRSTFFSKKGSRGSKLGENQNWISFLWRCFKGNLPRVRLLWAHDKSLTAIHSVLKWMHKYLKAHLDYCGDLAKSCEIQILITPLYSFMPEVKICSPFKAFWVHTYYCSCNPPFLWFLLFTSYVQVENEEPILGRRKVRKSVGRGPGGRG